jgi:hypothetical protein
MCMQQAFGSKFLWWRTTTLKKSLISVQWELRNSFYLECHEKSFTSSRKQLQLVSKNVVWNASPWNAP